jgi:hypothetical protein
MASATTHSACIDRGITTPPLAPTWRQGRSQQPFSRPIRQSGIDHVDRQ